MDLKEALAVAKRHVGEHFAAEAPRNIRLEEFLYDDHLAVWTLTIGFAVGGAQDAPPATRYKIVRVSEASKAVLSARDR
jgi:hypothetical protein